MQQFKVGDKVKCVNASRNDYLEDGQVYLVESVYQDREKCMVTVKLPDYGLYTEYSFCFSLYEEPEDDLEEQKRNVLAELDYSRVEKAMTVLNWGWYPSTKVPTKEQHVSMLNDLINRAIELYRKDQKDKRETYVGSGGWTVRIYPDEEGPILNVTFEVVEADGKYV